MRVRSARRTACQSIRADQTVPRSCSGPVTVGADNDWPKLRAKRASLRSACRRRSCSKDAPHGEASDDGLWTTAGPFDELHDELDRFERAARVAGLARFGAVRRGEVSPSHPRAQRPRRPRADCFA